MRTFTLHLQSVTRHERIDEVASFVGEDGSGSFGILGGRARFMTVLAYGLARYRSAEGAWQYLACPGAVLYFADNQLFINTRRYLRDDNYERISTLLTGQLLAEESQLKSVKESLQRLEQELFRRLRDLERQGGVRP
jgi:F-type H+-transporting ATPase subunit epsilon